MWTEVNVYKVVVYLAKKIPNFCFPPTDAGNVCSNNPLSAVIFSSCEVGSNTQDDMCCGGGEAGSLVVCVCVCVCCTLERLFKTESL